MNAVAPADFVAELECAIAAGSPERRTRMLWQVTDLLMAGRDRLSEPQTSLFDDVLVRLMDCVDGRPLAELSAMLADLALVPKETVRRLALHEDATVATPVLLRSEALSSGDLAAVARSRSEQHLLALAQRRSLDQALTDIVLARGSMQVCRQLVKNAGAQFSAAGYSTLLGKAERDSGIAEALALRSDMPAELLKVAPEAVPLQVRKASSAGAREGSRTPTGDVAPPIAKVPPAAVDYSEAQASVVALNRIGKLNDSTVNRFAIRGEHTNLIAALSVLSGAGVEIVAPLMQESDCEGLIMACRASRLNWQTTLAVLNSRSTPRLSRQEQERARELFDTLYLSAAQWTVRWGSPGATDKPAPTDSGVATAGSNR
jgi:uncharacterized protein (DUF2336 family)